MVNEYSLTMKNSITAFLKLENFWVPKHVCSQEIWMRKGGPAEFSEPYPMQRRWEWGAVMLGKVDTARSLSPKDAMC